MFGQEERVDREMMVSREAMQIVETNRLRKACYLVQRW